MTDYMTVAKIEGQSLTQFWAEADKIIARRKALMRQLNDLQESPEREVAPRPEERVPLEAVGEEAPEGEEAGSQEEYGFHRISSVHSLKAQSRNQNKSRLMVRNPSLSGEPR